MLLKDDQARPSMSEILSAPLVQRYMTRLIQTNCAPPNREGPFELEASATALIRRSESEVVKRFEPEEKKGKVMTARESLKQRKEEETKKKFEEMKLATRAAHIQIAM